MSTLGGGRSTDWKGQAIVQLQRVVGPSPGQAALGSQPIVDPPPQIVPRGSTTARQAARDHRWRTRTPRSALRLLPVFSPKCAPGGLSLALRAPTSTNIGAAGTVRFEESESAIPCLGRRLGGLGLPAGHNSIRRCGGPLSGCDSQREDSLERLCGLGQRSLCCSKG